MNTKEENEFAASVARVLDHGVREMDAQTAARLLKVRKEALAHFKEQPVFAWAPAWASAAVSRISEPFSHNLRAGFILLAFLSVVAGAIAWQNMGQQSSDVAELDQALLTDELPINAYLDKGFDAWLKRP